MGKTTQRFEPSEPDKYGRRWLFPVRELCPECGQPDSCGDCNHEPLNDDEAEEIGCYREASDESE